MGFEGVDSLALGLAIGHCLTLGMCGFERLGKYGGETAFGLEKIECLLSVQRRSYESDG